MDNQEAIKQCANYLPRGREIIRVLDAAPMLIKTRPEAKEARELAVNSLELVVELLVRVKADIKRGST
ncbi:MAG: hypothetical protein COA96_14135 [SAR86 cluster bacterium]|uniref:Uncharacterized protein n=1 Tax=SAR86 cluster bacterium TaxID=2030880 RepID=A0A2A5AT64_9GAMM|nr:MAG: hypothetical protein COA96_14135 [SAR86 cluster bacterium]